MVVYTTVLRRQATDVDWLVREALKRVVGGSHTDEAGFLNVYVMRVYRVLHDQTVTKYVCVSVCVRERERERERVG